MLGQGRPQLENSPRVTSRLAVVACWLSCLLSCLATLSIPLTLFAAERTASAADQTQDTDAVALMLSRSRLKRPVFDVSTAPFVFQHSDPQWPLLAASSSGKLQVQIRNHTEHANRELQLVYELIRVDDGKQVAREQTTVKLNESGDSRLVDLAASVPDQEGVYEIRCKLIEKSGKIWGKFTSGSQTTASVRLPWLVYTPKDPDRVLENQLIDSWTSIGNAKPFDEDAWQTPAWIADTATELVPTVKRVGEALPLPGWGESDEQSKDSFRVVAGRHVVAKLPPTQPHQTYRMLLRVSQLTPQQAAIPLVIEIAKSPKFDLISRTIAFTVDPSEDVTGGPDASNRYYELLHFAAIESEYVRIHNQADQTSLAIDSFELFETNTAATSDESNAVHSRRQVSLDLRNANWPQELTTDYDDLVTRHRFSHATEMCFRLWKATRRLPQHARWYGYDAIRFPIALPDDQWFASESNGDDPPAMQWANALRMQAFHHWFDASLCRAVGKHAVECSEASDDELKTVVLPIDQGAASAEGDSAALPKRRLTQAVSRDGAQHIVLAAEQMPHISTASARELLREFQQMPLSVQQATSSDPESEFVHLYVDQAESKGDQAESKGILIASLVNDAPWPSEVEFSFADEMAQSLRRCNQADGSAVPNTVSQSNPTKTTAAIVLPPMSITNWCWEEHKNSRGLQAWKATIHGGRESRNLVKEHISEIVGKIGTLAQPSDYAAFKNGGFELAGQVGVIGWMHTQFPDTAVVLDASEALEGKQSICMTTLRKSAGQTWLVSEPIPVPSTGRLAVSLATRSSSTLTTPATSSSPPAKRIAISGEASVAVPVHRLRVSLEGTQRGEPLRFSRELEIPRDGEWQAQRIVLETEQMDPQEMSTVRLTIDSLSAGKIWIDDVHLHDRFPTQAEREALKGSAFLAVHGLQRGNLKPAAQLLHNEWAKHLLSGASFSDAAIASRDASGDGRPTSMGEIATNSRPGNLLPTNSSASPNVLERPAKSSIPLPVPRKHDWARAANSSPTVESEPARRMNGSEPRESVADRLRDWLPKPLRF